MNDRVNCPMRHQNGNCLPVGRFCTAINDDMCARVRKACNDSKNAFLEQVKKLKPVKPKLDIDTYVCGVCGTRLERQSMIGPNVIISEFLDYCPVCGQVVKWDD